MRPEDVRAQLSEVLAEFVDAKQDSPGFLDAAVTVISRSGSEVIRELVDESDPEIDLVVEAALRDVKPASPYSVITVDNPRGPSMYLCSMTINSEYSSDFVVMVHVLLSRPPQTRLPPRFLRQFVQTVEVALSEISELEGLDKFEFAYLAVRARVMPLAMSFVADSCRAQGSMLWSYDYDDETYRSVHGFGPVGKDFKVRFKGVTRTDGTSLGVVGQASPSMPLVVYSRSHPERRTPSDLGYWEPHDPSVMEANEWDACVAWPVISDGYLLGAITIYGSDLDGLRYDRKVRNACALLVAETLRDIELRSELRESELAFEEELSKAAHGRMAGELVHDYKTALETIETLLKNLPADRLPPALQAMHAETVTSISYLKDVTRSLSKLTRGQRPSGTTDLAATVLSGEAFLRAMAKNENPRALLQIRAPKQLPKGETCQVDMDDLTALRVVGNLVHNAAVWTGGQDHPEIAVTVRPAQSPRRTRPVARARESGIVRLTVADNGPGVDRVNAHRIFARGWTNRRAAGGSGLGLYIVRKAVEDAGGTISEVGRANEGAIFEIRLPAHRSRERGGAV